LVLTTYAIPKILFCILFLNTISVAADFSGIVTDEFGKPIFNAVVRIQGSPHATQSDSTGQFRMGTKSDSTAKHLTAWSSGFFNGGAPISKGRKWYELRLKAIPDSDNLNYAWLPCSISRESDSSNHVLEGKPCEQCHPKVAKQWRQDAHSKSAVNPLFRTFFYGTNTSGEKGIGPGYKLDFPNSNGNCATCHIPISGMKNPFNSDPDSLDHVAAEGINCDFCHKISGAEIDITGGRPGILSYKFTRPSKGNQIFYGPLDDVFPGDDSYHPLYKQSRYCAPCHHGRFWNVLVYSEFQEWADSSYAKRNIHCQQCHMKPDGVMTRFASKKHGGVVRNPATLASHVNFGIKDVQFMRESISLKTQASLVKDRLHVTAVVKNVSAGHHYPTGNPMRNMLLLVEATDRNGQRLTLVKGEKLPEWAGVGPENKGNYAGLPGRGYAKVLKDLLLYPDRGRSRDFVFEYPAPHWRPTLIEYDSRIPADGTDITSYQFQVLESTPKPIQVTTRLIYRRAYKKWIDAKGSEIADLELAINRLAIKR
jgi:hypothetical protein